MKIVFVCTGNMSRSPFAECDGGDGGKVWLSHGRYGRLYDSRGVEFCRCGTDYEPESSQQGDFHIEFFPLGSYPFVS